MTAERIQRLISFAVFGIGIVAGVWGWLGYLGAMFVFGQNDCPQEILAITFATATPLPACILALWWRFIPGLWLVFAALFYPFAMLAQRNYMIQVRHFTDQPTPANTVAVALKFVSPTLIIGLFAVITGLLKWPRLIGESKTSLVS